MSASRARLWTRLGFGSGPGNTEEGRAFLQRRVAFYLGTLSAMWLAILASGYISARIFMPQLIEGAEPTRAGLGHMFGTLAMILAWLYARSGRRSLLTLSLLEVGVTLGQALICAFIMSSLDMGYQPDLSMILGGATALIARAATVPTRATRTAVVGVAASLPLLIAAALVHLEAPAAQQAIHPGMVITQDAMWLVFIVGLSTADLPGHLRPVAEGAGGGAPGAIHPGAEDRRRAAWASSTCARHALLRRPTAIKLLPPGASAGQQDLARFEREVQTHQRAHATPTPSPSTTTAAPPTASSTTRWSTWTASTWSDLVARDGPAARGRGWCTSCDQIARRRSPKPTAPG